MLISNRTSRKLLLAITVAMLALTLFFFLHLNIGIVGESRLFAMNRHNKNVTSSSSPASVEVVPLPPLKLFAYLTQTEQCLPPHWLPSIFLGGNGTLFDVFVLSYRRNCTEHTHLHHVFYIYDQSVTTKTTWTMGRNLLYETAKIHGNYSYFILMDDDILLVREALGTGLTYPEGATLHRLIKETSTSNTSVLREYESFLLDYKPYVSSPNFCASITWCDRMEQRQVWPQKCAKNSTEGAMLPSIMYTRQFDAAFNAFRSDAANELLPYDTSFDRISWWESQLKLIFDVPAKGQRMVNYYNLTLINAVHRPYPRRNLRGARDVFKLIDKKEQMKFATDEQDFINRKDMAGFLHRSNVICESVIKHK